MRSGRELAVHSGRGSSGPATRLDGQVRATTATWPYVATLIITVDDSSPFPTTYQISLSLSGDRSLLLARPLYFCAQTYGCDRATSYRRETQKCPVDNLSLAMTDRRGAHGPKYQRARQPRLTRALFTYLAWLVRPRITALRSDVAANTHIGTRGDTYLSKLFAPPINNAVYDYRFR